MPVSQLFKDKQQKKEKVSNSQRKDNTVTSFQDSSNSSVWDELKFVRVNLIDLSHRGWIKRKRTAKRGSATHRGYKERQWQTERKEQPHPIRDKDRTSLNTKTQPDKDTHI